MYASKQISVLNLNATGSHRIAYQEWPRLASPLQGEQQQAVLCMHGLTRNSHDFDFLAAKLVSDYQVLAPSMAGRGDSEWLPNKLNYHYGTYLADTMSLLDQLHLQSVLWVGTSMGGILGIMAASMYPGRVKALVLNDVGMKVPKEGLQRIAEYAGSKHTFASQEEAGIFLKEIFSSFGITDPAHWDHLIRHSLTRQNDGTYILACDPDILVPMAHQTEWFKMIQDVDLSLVWYGVRCPVLILRGEESDILTKEIADTMAAGKQNVTLVEFDGIGHAPALMNDQQTGIVAEWLKRLA